MNSYLDNSHKCIVNIKKIAADLSMKLLRNSVPHELFKKELNTIVDQCAMVIADAEKESLEISKSNILQKSSLLTNDLVNEDFKIDDNFFDEDPFDYKDTGTKVTNPLTKLLVKAPPKDDSRQTSANVGIKRRGLYNASTSNNALDEAIAKSKSKCENLNKRKRTCLVEPASTPAENLQANGNYTQDDDGWVTAYIDGSCIGNGTGKARAGLGVWFSNNSTLNLAEPVKGRLTNNVGEIEAAIRAIEQAHSVGITKLRLKTDSMFLINCITKWRLVWEKNGWCTAAKKPVINRPEIQKLTKTMDDTKVAIRWEHVKAHSNIIGNEAADFLAKQGADKCAPREFSK